MLKVTIFIQLCAMALVMLPVCAFGQHKSVSRADKWYKDRSYKRAIPVYEAALREKFKLQVAHKLAHCYRYTNDWVKAQALLDSVVLEDRAREDLWFMYGEALMSNGRYEAAREWFLKVAHANPDDSLAIRRAEACLIVGQLPPLFPEVIYTPLSFNSAADDHAAFPWADGLVFTSDRTQGIRLLKERSTWTGRDFLRLYYTQPDTDSTWTNPMSWSSRLNLMNANTGYAVLAPDTSGVYLTRNIQEPNERGLYTLQIYYAPLTGADKWGRPEMVSFANTAFNMMHPAISPDGSRMVFASDRPGGMGGLDLWIVHRRGDAWSRPEHMGPIINTAAHDAFPYFSPDGRLFFASRGHPGFGGYDLFVTTQHENGAWTTPVNLGRPLNSPMDDITFYLLSDGKSGYFSSTRDGGDDDLYHWWTTDPAAGASE
jgi:hypothetical protein